MIDGVCLSLSNRRCEAFFDGLPGRIFTGPNHVLSEWPNQGEYLMPLFYKRLKEKAQSKEFSDTEIDEVIARCRLLRYLPRKKALSAAHAMAVTLQEIVDRIKPTFFVSRMVDRYSNDLLDRLCEKRGIRVITFVQGMFPDLTRLTRRGEYNFVRKPDREEIEALVAKLSKPAEVVEFAIKRSNFTRRYYYKNLALKYAKRSYLSALRMVKRDPLNYQWILYSLPVDASGDFRGYGVVHVFDSAWKSKLDNRKGKAVAVPLAHIPEATTDYWIENPDFLDYFGQIHRICKSNPDITFAVKDHWSGMGMKPRSFFEGLRSLPNVVLIPPDAIAFRELLSSVDAVLSGEGTAGLEALIAGVPVVFYDEPSFYIPNTHSVLVKQTSPLLRMSELISNLETGKDEQLTWDLCEKALSSTFRGSTRYLVDAHEPANLDRLAREIEGYIQRQMLAGIV